MTLLKVTGKIQIPVREFEFTFARSSGPGGQNVNKVNTKATLTWNLDETSSLPTALKDRFRSRYRRRINREGQVVIQSQRYRDQGRNIADCLAKLQELLRSVAQPPKKRKATRPSKGSIRRRLESKKANSAKKESRKQIRPDD